jgi:hypothetical protein
MVGADGQRRGLLRHCPLLGGTGGKSSRAAVRALDDGMVSRRQRLRIKRIRNGMRQGWRVHAFQRLWRLEPLRCCVFLFHGRASFATFGTEQSLAVERESLPRQQRRHLPWPSTRVRLRREALRNRRDSNWRRRFACEARTVRPAGTAIRSAHPRFSFAPSRTTPISRRFVRFAIKRCMRSPLLHNRRAADHGAVLQVPGQRDGVELPRSSYSISRLEVHD